MKWIWQSLTVIIGAILLSSFAIFNKYPFVYPDTGSYIAACFQKFIPGDRPIAYSWFIKHTSLNESLWLVVLSQGILVSFLLYTIIKKIFKFKYSEWINLLVIIFLSLTSGISFLSSQLMPDIFTPIAALCAIILLFGGSISVWLRRFVIVLFSFSIACHFSNILTFSVILGLIFIYLIVKYKLDLYYYKRYLTSLTLSIFFAFLINPLIGFIYAGELVFFPPERHAFTINRLYDSGILDDYLTKTCDHKPTIFCELKGVKYYDLLWDNNSPLNKYGGRMNVRKECIGIINEIMAENYYKIWLLKDSFKGTLKQLIRFNTGIDGALTKGSAPYGAIEWHFSKEKVDYLNSKQNTGKTSFKLINTVQKLVVITSLIVLVFLTLFVLLKRNREQHKLKLLIFTLAVILVNAGTTASFSVIDDRFTSRVIWLIPFFTILISYHLYLHQRSENL